MSLVITPSRTVIEVSVLVLAKCSVYSFLLQVAPEIMSSRNKYSILPLSNGFPQNTAVNPPKPSTAISMAIEFDITLASARNEAANFPHQSTAGDITLHAGIRIYKEMAKWNTKIVNTVHDSIIFEIPMIAENIMGISNLASNAMTQVPIDWGLKDIPFTTDTDIGFLWGELHELDTMSQEVV